MVFSSLIFLFAFLPLTLAVYFAVPFRFRNIALFVVSLIFYGWGEPLYIIVMIFSIVTAYAFGFPIGKYRDVNKKKARFFLCLSLILNLAMLAFFKYYNFFAENLSLLPFLYSAKSILPFFRCRWEFHSIRFRLCRILSTFTVTTRPYKRILFLSAHM